MAILITGGAGFIGVHLARRLLDAGQRPVLYDLRFTEPDDLPGATTVVGDIRDGELLARTIAAEDVTAVVHLATLLTATCETNPAAAADVNCVGTAALFQAALQGGVKHIVYGSSVAALGGDQALPTGDDHPYGPVSVYGATKVFAEQLAAAISHTHPETTFTGLRFGWVYGPGRERGWTEMQETIEGFALERSVVPYPDYAAPNDWTYIDDAVEAVTACLQRPPTGSGAYNVSGDYRSIREAVRHLQQRFPTVRAEPYPAELPAVAWNFTTDRLTALTGYTARVPLEEGLDRTVEAIRQRAGLPAITP
jgi:nucleoside-diphosphate-sugar epimerase